MLLKETLSSLLNLNEYTLKTHTENNFQKNILLNAYKNIKTKMWKQSI